MNADAGIASLFVIAGLLWLINGLLVARDHVRRRDPDPDGDPRRGDH
ncbi:MAG: hypothetical protein ACRCV5_11840 [Afipia sp.]